MLLWSTFLQAEHTEVYTSPQSKLHLTLHLQLTSLTQRYEGGLVCIPRQQSKGETLSHQLQTTNMHEQRWRTVYNLLLRGTLDQHPGISVLVLSCCSDLKKKNYMAKTTEERSDSSQLPVHHKVGKSESGKAAAHSTATAGIREQWTHLAAQLPFLHVYGPGSQTEHGATHSWHFPPHWCNQDDPHTSGSWADLPSLQPIWGLKSIIPI